MRITGITCDGGGTGTGFLVDARHVATVAHVVEDTTTIVVRDYTGKVARGTVVGSDPDREVALIELDRDLTTTKALRFSNDPPQLFDDVVAIGFPLGRPVAVTEGQINALDASVDITNGPSLSGLLQFDANINPGNSGGPVINASGDVAGLAEAEIDGANGLFFAVPAAVAKPLIDVWKVSPEAAERLSCPESSSIVQNASKHPDAPAVAPTLARFFTGLNAGTDEVSFNDGSTSSGYELAATTLTKQLRKEYPDADELEESFAGYSFSDITLKKVNNPGELEDTAEVSLKVTSSDELGAVESCGRGSLTLTLRVDSGQWKLSEIEQLEDVEEQADC